MFQTLAEVVDKQILTDQILLLTLKSEVLADNAKPGQFVNIRISNSYYPYLRRPFSFCDVSEDTFKILFRISGQGTEALAEAISGQKFDVIGPLGKGFSLNDEFENAVFVGGGLGVAPFPFLTRSLFQSKKIYTYVGAQSNDLIVTYGLKNFKVATDDGSNGFKGNVVELLKKDLLNREFVGTTKVFGCGPTPMLRSLKLLCDDFNLNCEISTEAAMACGFGICQGCPIESSDSLNYKLVCKDGPVFNIKEIKI